MNQQQKSGAGSINIQIETVSTGLTYNDVKGIASDLFKENMAKLVAVAKDVAEARAEEIRNEIFAEIEKQKQVDPQSFSQVEKQIILIEAQKSYAISGDAELKNLLVKAVVSASSAPERSMKSITLGEAVKIAPLLTNNQIKFLGMVFAIRYVNFFKPENINELFDLYLHVINLTEKHISLTAGDVRHLEYLGCGTMGLASISFYDILKADYSGLLCAGFSHEELQAAFHPEPVPQIMRICHRDASRWEIATHRQNLLDVFPLLPNQRAVAKQKIQERLIDEKNVIAELEKHSEISAYLYKQWSEFRMGNFQITSVGVAIGYAYIAERVSDLADLNIWL